MVDVEKRETRPHQLSPSAWNRYETCPRMYWLSRQRLPRKAGMAASLGTAVHASIEDLLNMSLDGRVDDEAGWLPLAAEGFLKDRWEEEKAVFLATPRRPDWKESKWNEAKKQQKGGIILLLDHINARELPHERITVALWKHLQSLAIAVEGELVTSDARLMGRLDLLFAELDEKGAMKGWLVADLKTGNAPTKELKTEVNRQLRMYRDILLANNPDAPPVRTEGWYTKTVSKWAAEGESVLEEAYAAWEATQPTTMPMDAQPGPETCGGFCDWKAWCPHWWTWRQSSGTLHQSDFSDALFVGSQLQYTEFRYSDLSGANLSGSFNYGGSDWLMVNLSGADLTNAWMYDVDLRYADLTGANLTGARLAYLNPSYGPADITGVTWTNAICPDGVPAFSVGNTCANNL